MENLKLKKPEWLLIRPPKKSFNHIKKILEKRNLKTVCQEAHCPNMSKCWDNDTATFMVMGDVCTRGCRFCAIKTGRPEPLDKNEPYHLAKTVKEMGLKFVVLTSVDRDDLIDKGAIHFGKCIVELKKENILVESLIPDYQEEELKHLVFTGIDVLSHNIEVVERLTPLLRDRRAGYQKSLNTLRLIKKMNPKVYTKSSIMLGLGEKKEEVIQAMKDLRNVNVDFLTFGQYLSPSIRHAKIVRFVHPDEFEEYKDIAFSLGFRAVFSGPFVRSSYKAKEMFENAIKKNC